MSFTPELVTTLHETPVFYEALSVAADMTAAIAEKNFHEVEEMTDLHKVETFLELTASA